MPARRRSSRRFTPVRRARRRRRAHALRRRAGARLSRRRAEPRAPDRRALGRQPAAHRDRARAGAWRRACLIAVNPTRGLDIAATAHVHALLAASRGGGRGRAAALDRPRRARARLPTGSSCSIAGGSPGPVRTDRPRPRRRADGGARVRRRRGCRARGRCSWPRCVAARPSASSVLLLAAAGADPIARARRRSSQAPSATASRSPTRSIKSCPLVLDGPRGRDRVPERRLEHRRRGPALDGRARGDRGRRRGGRLPLPLAARLALASGGCGRRALGGARRDPQGAAQRERGDRHHHVELRRGPPGRLGRARPADGGRRRAIRKAIPCRRRRACRRRADGVHAGIVLAALLVPAVWCRAPSDRARLSLARDRRQSGGRARRRARAGARDRDGDAGERRRSPGSRAPSRSTGVTGRLFEQFSGGQGYTAIAVALLAPPASRSASRPSALFFGALAAGSGAMQRTAGVSAVFVAIVQATVILALLAADSPSAGRRGLRSARDAERRA